MDAVLDTLRLFGRDESSCASMTTFLTGTLGMNLLISNQGVRCLQPCHGPFIVVQQVNRLSAGVEVVPGEIAIDLGVRNVDMLWRELEWKGVTLLTGVMGLDHERAFFLRICRAGIYYACISISTAGLWRFRPAGTSVCLA